MTELMWIITGSLMILAVIVIRKSLGRRLRPAMRYALWGLVLVRLLYPGTLWQSPVSIQSAASGSQIVRDMETVWDMDDIRLEEDGSVTGLPRQEAENVPPQSGEAIQAGTDSREPEKYVPVATDVTPEHFARMERTINFRQVLEVVWLTGIIVMAVMIVVTNLILYVKLRRRRTRVQADCPVRVWAVEGLDSSCLFAGAIYVNGETVGNPERLRHVLAHELSHRRHLDPVWSVLRCAALAIHWYNPLVWYATVLSRQDGELCADAGAIRRLGLDTWDSYGETLIELSRKPESLSPLSAATTMGGTKRQLKERVIMIAKRPRATIAVALAAALIAAIAAGCAFAGKVEEKQNGGTPEDENPAVLGPEALVARPYKGDGWTMDVPGALSGEKGSVELHRSVKSDSSETYYAFNTDEESWLNVYHLDGSARDNLQSYAGGGQVDWEGMVCVAQDGDEILETYFIDDPRGGCFEIQIHTVDYLDALHAMLETFTPLPNVSKYLDVDDILRQLLLETEPEDLTLTFWVGTDHSVTIPGDGCVFADEHLKLIQSKQWVAPTDPDKDTSGSLTVLETDRYTLSIYAYDRCHLVTQDVDLWFEPSPITYYLDRTSQSVVGALMEWYYETVTAMEHRGNGTPLTAEEITAWRLTLDSETTWRDEKGEYLFTSPSAVSGFFRSDWSDPRDLDLGELLYYFGWPEGVTPVGYNDATEEEIDDVWKASEEKSGRDLSYMRDYLPCSKIPASVVDIVLEHYAGITLDDLHCDWRNEVLYLEKYDSFYSFASDFDPGSFYPEYGEREGDILTLWSTGHVLRIQETPDGWKMLSHMPTEGIEE